MLLAYYPSLEDSIETYISHENESCIIHSSYMHHTCTIHASYMHQACTRHALEVCHTRTIHMHHTCVIHAPLYLYDACRLWCMYIVQSSVDPSFDPHPRDSSLFHSFEQKRLPFGTRGFSFSCLSAWNKLSPELTNQIVALLTCKTKFKTYFFQL